MARALTPKQLEQAWIKFQFDIAAVRGTFGPMYQASFEARKAHTFYVGAQPETRLVGAVMGPTGGEPNGVPDGHAIMSGGSYGARFASTSTAQVVLIAADKCNPRIRPSIGRWSGCEHECGRPHLEHGTD